MNLGVVRALTDVMCEVTVSLFKTTLEKKGTLAEGITKLNYFLTKNRQYDFYLTRNSHQMVLSSVDNFFLTPLLLFTILTLSKKNVLPF